MDKGSGSGWPKKTGSDRIRIRIRSRNTACDQCDFSATRPDGLKYHKKTQHEGSRYSCEMCDFSCTSQQYLEAHINSKHKGTRYPCDMCDYSANIKRTILKHRLSQHSVKISFWQGSIQIFIPNISAVVGRWPISKGFFQGWGAGNFFRRSGSLFFFFKRLRPRLLIFF